MNKKNVKIINEKFKLKYLKGANWRSHIMS